jgi:hypothetical protein
MDAMTARAPARKSTAIRRALYGFGLLLVFGAIGSVWLTRHGTAMATAPALPPAVPVDVATATRDDVPVDLTGLGMVQGSEHGHRSGAG